MIRISFYCWIAYWGLVLLMPVHSLYPAVVEAFLLQLAFVSLVWFAYTATLAVAPPVGLPDVFCGDVPSARSLVRWSLCMSLLGLLFLIFDKMYIQHIDYSSGLAVAREQWRELGEDREGRASSIWSAAGYLLGSAYYITMVLAITQPKVFSARQRLTIVAMTFLFALANSVITGGRSNFLLIAAVAVAAFTARTRLRIRDVFTTRRQRRMVIIVAALAMSYIAYVFYARAQAGQQLLNLYVINFLPVMGLQFDRWYVESVGKDWIAMTGDMMVLVFGYLSHSFATTAAIIDAPAEDKVMLFGNAASIMYKLGLVGRPDDQWFLAGRFPSVPGALWHEFGPLGFVAGSFLIGIAAACSRLWAAARPRLLLPLGAYVLMGATLMLTPFVFAPDLLSFPFIVTALVLLACISRFRVRLTNSGVSMSYLVPRPRAPQRALQAKQSHVLGESA